MPGQAIGRAQASLASGFAAVSQSYASGWHSYLRSLPPPPASARGYTELYDVSLMVLKASEDKTWRGGFIAAPAMPWVFGTYAQSDVYHLVWARDEYEMATALLAAGDRAAAQRALDYLFNVQQKADGSFPQNSRLDGTPVWGGLQMDEVADPIILAWQLGRFDAPTYAHVRRAAGFIVANGPQTPGERWENQAAGLRRRLLPRSPGWCVPPTSPATTVTPSRRHPGTPSLTPGSRRSRPGR